MIDSIPIHPECVIESLGEPKARSPLNQAKYVTDGLRVLHDVYFENVVEMLNDGSTPLSFERAGPREHLFFEPATTRVGIVTCGGLCPGINSVVRSVVMELWYVYGVHDILGFRFGYMGLSENPSTSPLALDPTKVGQWHERGGSFLGSSRGTPPSEEIVDSLEKWGINFLLTIGGDGTLRGARAIHEESQRRGLKIGVIGIPKTIDNDVPYMAQTFGFDTAVSTAADVIRSAHEEAEGYDNGIAIVKLMGRHSGYIAATACLAQKDANFCLIPEIQFDLEGPGGLLDSLEKRLARRHHALIVVAEGVGQDLFAAEGLGTDASGNPKLGDIGQLLKKKIQAYLKDRGVNHSIKYLDPSYHIRSVQANSTDRLYCGMLAQNAVHAGMAGKTNLVVSRWNNLFVHVPIPLTQNKPRRINEDGNLWQSVLRTTGQPASMLARKPAVSIGATSDSA